VFWIWVSAGCALCGLAGFSTARLGTRKLLASGERERRPREDAARLRMPLAAATAAPVREPAPRTAAPRGAAPPRRPRVARSTGPSATSSPPPAPTSERPEPARLALWARQVKAGERKMSIATDGCRVTWNRTCKHGHPSWLVYLGYLKRVPSPKRHNPR
jgi:hypothetical protein